MIHHTKNKTTVTVGQATATVVADTESRDGSRITTFELVYPRYIHSELMTHRAFSRNASSSRATPLSVTLDEVEKDPVFFDFVGKNQPGMVAGEGLGEDELHQFKLDWYELGKLVADRVAAMADWYGIHKQTLNRALEPWLRIRTLVTATDWQNFFRLRLAPDAQPEMRSLAYAMKLSRENSTPKSSDKHIPYMDECAADQTEMSMMMQSVARCARVSYARHDGKVADVSEDMALYARLFASGHMSPFEHVAVRHEGRNGNFDGWASMRWLIENGKLNA